jgi:hypothetical protein
MGIKSNYNPIGLDYDIDDDPSETESIGSTKNVKVWKKTEENTRNERQNNNTIQMPKMMCSNIGRKHTDEDEWRTSTKGRRKPKGNHSGTQLYESIITSIETDTKKNNKGAPEAEVNSLNRKTKENKKDDEQSRDKQEWQLRKEEKSKDNDDQKKENEGNLNDKTKGRSYEEPKWREEDKKVMTTRRGEEMKPSITPTKKDTKKHNKETSKVEENEPIRMIRNTKKNNEQKKENEDKVNDKINSRTYEEPKWREEEKKETTTRRGEVRKDSTGNANMIAKYNEQASRNLMKVMGIQQTRKDMAAVNKTKQSDKENESRRKKLQQQEGIQVTTNTKEVTREENNNNMDTNSGEEKRNENNNNSNEQNNNEDRNIKDNSNNTNSNNKGSNNEKGDPDGRKQGNGKNVKIIDIADMDTYTFTIGWNPKDYRGRDGKAVLQC